MKVPDPIRKVYNCFPLYTFTEADTPNIKDTLYLYSPDTRDPDCLLARAILARYKIPHKVQGVSAYITPSNKLPIFRNGKSKKVYDIGQMIEEFVPPEDRQEPVYMAVLDKVKNAYYTLLQHSSDHTNYLSAKDRKRLWPLNRTIYKQTALEAEAAIGYFRTTGEELRVALEALSDLAKDRSGIKLVDLALYAVLTPLDEIIEVPRELQREMVKVAHALDLGFNEQELVTITDSSPSPISSWDAEPAIMV